MNIINKIKIFFKCISIESVKDNIELIKETCKNKNISLDIDRLLIVDEEKRKIEQPTKSALG